MRPYHPRLGVRQLMVGVALTAVLFGVIVYLGRLGEHARRVAGGSQCSGHLCQIALALHNYHASYGCLPPAYVTDSRGRPMHSWRALILPYMEQAPLYNAYNFAEPWNGPNNRKLARMRPSPFACPNGRDYGGHSTRTNFLAVVGPGTAFPGGRSTSFAEVSDGTADTIMVAEVADSGIDWLEPRDLDAGAMSLVLDDRTRPSVSSHDPRGPHVICVCGSRRVLNPAVPPRALKARMTIRGGEAVDIESAYLP